MKTNLAIASNIWIDPEAPDSTSAWRAAEEIPGDLMIDFIARENPLLNPREQQVLKQKLTPTQFQEYKDRRFFLSFGEQGAAFQQS